MIFKKHLTAILAVQALFILTLSITIPSNVFAANISSPSYAWSESIGWINFDSDAGNVSVSNTAITGHAYNDNTGWILLDGVSNDGNGNLSGYAWSESVGYIDFSNVTIESNEFNGYAYNDNTGWISFNCLNTGTCEDVDYKVSTTWTTPSSSTSTRSGGSSVSSRIKNLENMGKTEEANELRERFDIAPTTTPTNTNIESLKQVLETLVSIGIISSDDVAKALQALESLPSNNTNFTRDLQLNDRGLDVKQLQQYLISKGYSIPDGPSEFFGTQTQSALIKFQLDNNIIPPAGYFGPITRSFIK